MTPENFCCLLIMALVVLSVVSSNAAEKAGFVIGKLSWRPWSLLISHPLWFGVVLILVVVQLSVVAGTNATKKPANANYAVGKRLMNTGDYDGAIEAFLQATYFARNNYYPQAYHELGECYKNKHEDDKSVKAFTTYFAQATRPDPDAHIELGRIYMANHDNQKARDQFQQASMDEGKLYPPAHNAEGELLVKEKNYSAAAMEFETALGQQPWKYTEAWMNFTANLMHMKQWDKAIQQCNDLLDRGNSLKHFNRARIENYLGICLAAKGDHQGAIDAWHRAALANPSLVAPHILLAKTFESEQHLSSALNEYKAVAGMHLNPKINQQIQDKIMELEQKLGSPATTQEGQSRLSPYQERQMEYQKRKSKRQLNAQAREQMDKLDGGADSATDSGF